MKILHLPIKKKWFDMILSGEKKEEYRAISKHWVRRIFKKKTVSILPEDGVQYDVIKFVNGFGNHRPAICVECKGIEMGHGSAEWGAEIGVTYFVIKLGKIIKRLNISIPLQNFEI